MVLHHPQQGRQPWLPAASSDERPSCPIQATQNDEDDVLNPIPLSSSSINTHIANKSKTHLLQRRPTQQRPHAPRPPARSGRPPPRAAHCPADESSSSIRSHAPCPSAPSKIQHLPPPKPISSLPPNRAPPDSRSVRPLTPLSSTAITPPLQAVDGETPSSRTPSRPAAACRPSARSTSSVQPSLAAAPPNDAIQHFFGQQLARSTYQQHHAHEPASMPHRQQPMATIQ
ncbi:hypothetical protein ACLOJK_039677 [Asimina triloba]